MLELVGLTRVVNEHLADKPSRGESTRGQVTGLQLWIFYTLQILYLVLVLILEWY